MRQAGCVGINFGIDSGDTEMLQRLGRNYGPAAVEAASRHCRDAGIATMFDLLLGAPGETEGSLRATVDLMRRCRPDRVGVSVGVRIYPGTPLAADLTNTAAPEDPRRPRFYLAPSLKDTIFNYLDELIAGDPRFLFFDPTQPDRNYNYNANERLIKAIQAGYRGAYWDILRRLDG
jgi:radical SAM superfamily enzyme YgiQ (UPF0313 family)